MGFVSAKRAWILGSILGIAAMACSKEVKTTDTGASAEAVDGTRKDGDAVGQAGPGGNGGFNDIQKSLEKETQDRQKADQDLQKQIDELREKLAQLEARLTTEVERLDEQDKALGARLDAEIGAVKTQITELEQRLTDAAAADKAAIIAQINALEAKLDAFIATANKTYATKEELANVLKAVEALAQVVEILQGKVTKLDMKVDAELAKVRDDFHKDMDLLRADVEKMEDRLEDQIFKVQQLIITRTDSLINLISSITVLVTQNNASLQAQINQLTQRVGSLESFRDSAKSDLQAAIDQLKQADADSAARLQAMLDQAIAAEQQARQKLERQVVDMQGELERVAQVAADALRMSRANEINLTKLRDDFEDSKARFQSQLDGLKDDVRTVQADVQRLAAQVAQGLGVDLAQKFADINLQLATLNAKVTTLTTQVADLMQAPTGQPSTTVINVTIGPITVNVSNNLSLVIGGGNEVERALIDAIDPIAGSKGVDVAALAASFRNAATACGNAYADGAFPAVAGREYFMHLARAYVRMLLAGSRPADAKLAAIYYGFQPAVITSTKPQQDVLNKLLLAAFPSSAVSAGPRCDSAIETWAINTLLGAQPLSVNVRAALIKHQAVQVSVTALFGRIDAIKGKIEAWWVALRDVLLPQFANLQDLIAYLMRVGQDNVSMLDRVVVLILDLCHSSDEHATLAKERARIEELARKIAALQDQQDITAGAVTALNNSLKALTQRVTDLERRMLSVEGRVGQLEQVQIQTLQLLVRMAVRLGYFDIATDGNRIIEVIGGTPVNTEGPIACQAASHYYIHSTNRAIPTARCESLTTVAGTPLTGDDMTVCSIHGVGAISGGVAGYTWGNTVKTSNGWNVQGMVGAGGHLNNNGLTIKHYDPTSERAMTLAKRKPGDYPADGESTFVLRVIGNARSFAINVTSIDSRAFDPYSVTVAAAPFKVEQRQGAAVYEIPIPRAIQRLGACRWDREIEVKALDEDNTARGTSCLHRFHTFSPLVLDFTAGPMIRTVPPHRSQARFDLDANGLIERTGWVDAATGILARDLDGNGRIEDGRELFGEATLVGGKPAADGFAALAALDANGDGVVDAKDPAYAELLVWNDFDGDGVSRPVELRKLADVGVTRISVRAEKVDEKLAVQSEGGPEANLAPLRARFFGPAACGEVGCYLYDVYFGSTESTAYANR